MTAPSSAVTHVHTTDSTPDDPKYRISAHAGEDTAIVGFTIDPGNVGLRPGVSVRPGTGVRPSPGAFDVGNALVGEATPNMTPYIAAWLITKSLTPSAPLVGNLGAVCGIHRCGAPGVKPLHVELGRLHGARVVPTFTESVSYSEFLGGLAEGDNTINLFALVEPEGWA